MTALLHAHSGLRYLVLLAAAANLVVLGLGLAQKKPFGKLHRILGASFVGLLHTQVLLGLGIVATGLFYPQLIGHIAMMVLAAGGAQAAMTINRRRPEPNLKLPLMGVVFALLCIFGGVMAIGRGLFTFSYGAQG
jgi:predicted permease